MMNVNDFALSPKIIDTTNFRRINFKDIVWDVDGTLADVAHRRHFILSKPKDWKAFYGAMSDDPVHEDMRWLANSFDKAGHCNIICTGRPDSYKQTTLDWLFRNDIQFNAIYMRKADDFREDGIVKVELVQEMLADGFYPTMAFEDRDRVVLALRTIGMRVFQVEDGKF